DLDDKHNIRCRDPSRALLEHAISNHNNVRITDTRRKGCARRHLDLGNRLEPVGQVIFEEAGEPSRNALMPWVRARRHCEGPLTEFPPSRRVEFKRIPLLEAQQTTRQMCKLGHGAPPPRWSSDGCRLRAMAIASESCGSHRQPMRTMGRCAVPPCRKRHVVGIAINDSSEQI